MNTGSTFTTAMLRAFYSAVIAGLIAGIAFYQQVGNMTDEKGAVITGLAAGLAVLATRGLGEGSFDASRQAGGDVKASDVQPDGSGGV